MLFKSILDYIDMVDQLSPGWQFSLRRILCEILGDEWSKNCFTWAMMDKKVILLVIKSELYSFIRNRFVAFLEALFARSDVESQKKWLYYYQKAIFVTTKVILVFTYYMKIDFGMKSDFECKWFYYYREWIFVHHLVHNHIVLFGGQTKFENPKIPAQLVYFPMRQK